MARPKKTAQTKAETTVKVEDNTIIQSEEEKVLAPEEQTGAKAPTYFSKHVTNYDKLAKQYESNISLTKEYGTITVQALYDNVPLGSETTLGLVLNDCFGNSYRKADEKIEYKGAVIVGKVGKAVNEFNDMFPQDKQSTSTNHIERKVDLNHF